MQTLNLRDIYKPLAFMAQVCVDLRDLEDTLSGRANLAPRYQRGHKWTRAQQEAFVGHLLQGGEVLPLTFHRVPDSGRSEVLDGKQRLEACLAWLQGKVGARLDDGQVIMLSDLERDAQGRVIGLSRVTLTFRYVNLPWRERISYYVRMNSAGTPHTQEEISAALALMAEEPTAQDA